MLKRTARSFIPKPFYQCAFNQGLWNQKLASKRIVTYITAIGITTGAGVTYKIYLDVQNNPENQFKRVDNLLLEFSKDISKMQKYAEIGFEKNFESKEWLDEKRKDVMNQTSCYMSSVAMMKYLEEKLNKKLVIRNRSIDELCRRIQDEKFSIHVVHYYHTRKFFSRDIKGHIEVIVGHNGKFRIYQSSQSVNKASNFTLQEYLQEKFILQGNKQDLVGYLNAKYKKSMRISDFFRWGTLE